MTGADELNKRWEAAASRAMAPEMAFEGDWLVLGAQTRLAMAGAEMDEARLGALLAAAHGRPVATSSLAHIRRALQKKRDGDFVLALVHLALSALAKLRDPKGGARRLFLADALMNDGLDPFAIVKGLRLDSESPDSALGKYNPDQPRVPAGNPDGGQWTDEDWASSAPPRRRESVEVADASATRGREVASDAKPTTTAHLGPPDAQPFDEAQNLDESCQAFIAANCQARILRVFPGQYLACKLREVLEAAKAGDRDAQTACKLLFRKEYRK